jgi:hypothetical protein
MSSVEIYRDLQQQINADIAGRRSAFRDDVAALAEQRKRGDAKPSPLIVVSAGDSWFDYPLPTKGGGVTDVIESIRSRATVMPAICNLAHHGDATTEILGQTKRQRLIETLKAHPNAVDVILFSGGGDDLCGDQFRYWIKDFMDGPIANYDDTLNDVLTRDILEIVRASYEDLLVIRDKYAPNAVLVFHQYDSAYPSGIGVCRDLAGHWLIGPWLSPSLQGRGWNDRDQGQKIVAALLKRFRDMLADLCRQAPMNYVVPTFGLLSKDQWTNELHPSCEGFHIIADAFIGTLQAIPGFAKRI